MEHNRTMPDSICRHPHRHLVVSWVIKSIYNTPQADREKSAVIYFFLFFGGFLQYRRLDKRQRACGHFGGLLQQPLVEIAVWHFPAASVSMVSIAPRILPVQTSDNHFLPGENFDCCAADLLMRTACQIQSITIQHF